MRNISFAQTTAQVRDRSKTVTRRLGWRFLQAGDQLQPIVRGQGLHVERIGGPIRIVSVRLEPLHAMPDEDCALEGFAELTVAEFVAMFARTHECTAETMITRIAFEYLEEGAPADA